MVTSRSELMADEKLDKVLEKEREMLELIYDIKEKKQNKISPMVWGSFIFSVVTLLLNSAYQTIDGANQAAMNSSEMKHLQQMMSKAGNDRWTATQERAHEDSERQLNSQVHDVIQKQIDTIVKDREVMKKRFYDVERSLTGHELKIHGLFEDHKARFGESSMNKFTGRDDFSGK